jgi:hydrogenase nickel incorporation protein HypA/HybF
MHELAITESLVDCVVEHVANGVVRRVVLEIGKFSGIVPDAIRFCFDICAQGTILEGAALELLETPARAQCRECKSCFELENILTLCACGSANLELLSGRELKIKQVEVA